MASEDLSVAKLRNDSTTEIMLNTDEYSIYFRIWVVNPTYITKIGFIAFVVLVVGSLISVSVLKFLKLLRR